MPSDRDAAISRAVNEVQEAIYLGANAGDLLTELEVAIEDAQKDVAGDA